MLTPLELLKNVAVGSDDPDTKVGALAYDALGQHFMSAANRLPKNVKADAARLARPAKYDYIVHAEAELVAQCARHGHAMFGCTVWLSWYPCARCAGLLVDAGVSVLWCSRARWEERMNDARYGFSVASAILHEGKVQVRWLEDAT